MPVEVTMRGDDEGWKGADAHLLIDLSDTMDLMTVDGKSARDGRIAIPLGDLYLNQPVVKAVMIKTGAFAQVELDPQINLTQTSSAEARDYRLDAVVECRLQVIDPDLIPPTRSEVETLVVPVAD